MASASSRASTEATLGPVVRRLSREDLSILALEDDTVAGHTCKVIVLGDRIDPDQLRASIAARLGDAPQLCTCLGALDDEPCWVVDPSLDVDAHVVECELPELDLGELRAAVARIFEQRLDRSRPLWRIDVLPKLAGGGTALVWRIHHALADGSTAMRIARAALWDIEASSEDRARPARSADVVAHHRFDALRATVRELPQPWLRSPFNGHIGSRRSVAFFAVELAPLHGAAAAHEGATVNDAVLTVVAGGLRRWLEAHHGQLGAVRVKIPVSLHGAPQTAASERVEPGNRDSFFCLDLPLGSDDPLERMAAIQRATRIRKEGHDAQRLDVLMRQLGHHAQLRRFAERVLAHPRSFALNVSNVPGPREPVHVLGAPVRAIYSLAEIRERHALRIAVASFADTLSFGLVADPTLVSEVERIAGEMEAEAASLADGH